jgi:hypothetical protein
MKTEHLTITQIPTPVTFYIGTTQQENHAVIDLGSPTDLWFHVAETPSCHVVAILPEDCSRKQRGAIIRRGASLCKQYTASVRSQHHIPITYAAICSIRKDVVPGRVTVNDARTIVV